MTAKLRSLMARYGAKQIKVKSVAIEIRDPNDNAGTRYQYMSLGDTILRRVVLPGSHTITDWRAVAVSELSEMRLADSPILRMLEALDG